MRGTLRTALAIAAAMLLVAGTAHAEGPPDRAEYVSQVEPICQANTEANETILRNVRKKVRSGRLKEAGRQFIHASAAFGSAVDKITAVPRPPADEERLLKWFKFLRIVQTDLGKVGKSLKAGDRIQATHETIRVERSANAANNVSYVFEFHYCHLTQSRFT
jgi:membrane-bound lytic murein transglycosylase B